MSWAMSRVRPLAVRPSRTRSARARARIRWAPPLYLSLCALAGACAGAAPVASAQPGAASSSPTAPPTPSTEPSGDISLSNETTLTTWAHSDESVSIYSEPETGARRLARLHLLTEDGFPEVYMLLASYTDAQGREWVRLRIPGRPNGRTGWVERSALGAFHRTRWLLVISLRARTITAYYAGHVRFRGPVGIGKPSSPTPPGHFWIRERFKLANRSSPYWPYALGTSDYSTLTDWPGGGVVGIHGDFGEPQSIPGDPSHGCVRMRDSDIAWLAPRLTLGTPVHIE